MHSSQSAEINKTYTSEEIAKYKEEAIEFLQKQKMHAQLENVREEEIEKLKNASDEEIIKEINRRATNELFKSYIKKIGLFGIDSPYLNKVEDCPKEYIDQPEFDEDFKALECTLVAHQGFGIASSQIGIKTNMIMVMEQEFQGVKCLVNPNIFSKSDRTWSTMERTLSAPGASFPDIKRSRTISISYYGANGNYQEEHYGVEAPELSDEEYAQKFENKQFTQDEHWSIWHCRVIQHCMEMQDGKGLPDTLAFLKKDILRRKMKKQYKKAVQRANEIFKVK